MSAIQVTLDFLLLGCLCLGTLAAPSINRVLEESYPTLTAGYFQGDMEIDLKRNGILTNHWPNATVYFKIDRRFDAFQAAIIMESMRRIESVSCIRFLPASANSLAYLLVTVQQVGCSAEVGYTKRKQFMHLQIDAYCFNYGTIQHELLHTLGFYHQQSSSKRDEYVKILWENIETQQDFNFLKYTRDIVSGFGEAYDYGSLMHYHSTAFSKNGKPTIIALHPEGQALMGQKEGLSHTDIKRLNKMYNCYLHM